MIIVLVIIAILTTISFPYYLSAKRSLALDRSATKLVQDIRQAQEMAISAQEFNGSFPPGGYGIYFRTVAGSNELYITFADKDADKKQDNVEEVYPDPTYLENGVKIESLQATYGIYSTAYNHISAIFIPPVPNIFFAGNGGGDLAVLTGGGSESATGITIKLISKDNSSLFREVKINKAGLVWVE